MTSNKHVTSKFLRKENPDVYYGQTHPIENEDLIYSSLELLESEMENVPKDELAGYKEAERICPRLVHSRSHQIMFLRCEQYNCDMAAKRLAKYWKKRIKIFGDFAFDEKLTLDRALCRDRMSLGIGFIQQLPGTDSMGRAVALVQPRRLDRSKYTRDGMVRSVWYIMHAILESESAQKKGIVFIVDLQGSKMHHFDIKMVKECTSSIKGVLPLRVSAIHFCQTPKIFDIISGTVHLLLGDILRKRIKNHGSWFKSENDVKILESYGISRKSIPIDLGGEEKLDIALWLAARQFLEKSKPKKDGPSKSLVHGYWIADQEKSNPKQDVVQVTLL